MNQFCQSNMADRGNLSAVCSLGYCHAIMINAYALGSAQDAEVG